jgi:hypothetical protein
LAPFPLLPLWPLPLCPFAEGIKFKPRKRTLDDHYRRRFGAELVLSQIG